GLRLGISRILPLVIDRARIPVARFDQTPGQALLLCGRLEEVRAAVGRGDSRETAPDHDAVPRRRSVEGQSHSVRRPFCRYPRRAEDLASHRYTGDAAEN